MHVENKIYFLSSSCPVATSGLLGSIYKEIYTCMYVCANGHIELIFPMSLQICELSKFLVADSLLMQKLYYPQETFVLLFFKR